MRQHGRPADTSGGTPGERCAADRRDRIAAPKLHAVFVCRGTPGPCSPWQASNALKFRWPAALVGLAYGLLPLLHTDGRTTLQPDFLKTRQTFEASCFERRGFKNGDIDRASSDGNAPDHSKVTVPLVDVINDMESPGGGVLAARARPTWLQWAWLVLAAGLAGAGCEASRAPAPSAAKRYVATRGGYLLVLREGDDVLEQLRQLARAENVPSAAFTGFGFVHATFGYFDRTRRDYLPREFRDVELASLTGSLAWQDGQPSLHAHGVVTDREFVAHGGHILELSVGSGSVELELRTQPDRRLRLKDDALGANVLSLENH